MSRIGHQNQIQLNQYVAEMLVSAGTVHQLHAYVEACANFVNWFTTK